MNTFSRWVQRRRDRRDLIVLLACRYLEPVAGYELMCATGLGAGALYVALARLEDGGLLRSEWETPEPRPDGVPRRRYYSVTQAGVRGTWTLSARLCPLREGRPG